MTQQTRGSAGQNHSLGSQVGDFSELKPDSCEGM
jgi:hypothetical protein